MLTQSCGKLMFFFEDFFPSFPFEGFTGLYIEQVHVDDDFCQRIFPTGVSGFIFHGAIQGGILRFGTPSWLEGSV